MVFASFRNTDPYSRLRVPAYRKAFEAIFFVSFLILYYAVMVERDPNEISLLEALMYIWIAAFSYDELSGITDAGITFYQMDSWRIWNMGIIGTGLAFVITREYSSFRPRVCLAQVIFSRNGDIRPRGISRRWPILALGYQLK